MCIRDRLSFPTIDAAIARASVGFSVTDFSGGDGATLTGTGGHSGTAGYTAQYLSLIHISKPTRPY